MSLINWADVIGRYSNLTGALDASQAGSYQLPYAEAELNEKLSPGFTVPFSSNNLTAKDLCIDLVYARINRYSNPDKSKVVLDSISERVAALLAGKSAMLTTSGDTLRSSMISDGIWSSNEDYAPAFGMDDPEDQEIDPDRQQADYDARD